MKFTIKEIEHQARIKLLDTYEDNYRFQPTEMYHAMRDGMRFIRNIRPEAKYVDGLLTDKLILIGSAESDFVVPESFPVNIDETSYSLTDYREFYLNIEDRWMEPLVYYVIHQMYLKDDADTSNSNLASAYYAKFTECVKS